MIQLELCSVLVDTTKSQAEICHSKVFFWGKFSLNKNITEAATLLYVPKLNTVLFMAYQSRLQ